MPDYDFSGLSPRSFERLVQALAAKVLGLGTVVFGDGPDGGREAIYQGPVAYPSAANPWDGYIVVQAKFLQTSKGPAHDGKWAAAQLKDELEDFTNPKKRRKRPEYYILATNVVLSPVAEVGGKDRAEKVFKAYQRKLRIKGWRIWDFNQLCTYLDDNADIRRTYSAWTTPGDVLSAVIDGLNPPRPAFLDVMTNYLAKEMLTDQYANLGQAGHSTAYRIPLASVFVDLPVSPERVAGPGGTDRDGIENNSIGLVSTIVDAARERLDGSEPQTRTAQSLFAEPQTEKGRIVLVGGPGQGKTTVGQFACQLFRVALLRDRGSHLSPEVAQALTTLCRQCEADALPLPQARRFPLRIALSTFADTLARESEELTVLAYIARHLRSVTSFDVSTDDLRVWLSCYPWFIVFDGLDEVPASTNRDAVLRAITNFWVDAAQATADLLVLATTRPQGYNDDFSPGLYRHLWLAPLRSKEAMRYAARLATNRWGADTEQSRRVLEYLDAASKQEATARLMRSPLQITIMATLVEQIGPPPQERWRLFSRYYDVIYGREQERAIATSQLLRDHRPDIDAIHSEVALILQLESESAGGAEARLSRARFERIVISRLKNEGHDEKVLRQLTERIIEAATNRLVFLVSPQHEQIGFEIRSLQEFMAAEALMRGSDQSVQDRLRRIAPLSSWRNVFLFAAGRCFVHEQHRRDTICAICQELNTATDLLVKTSLAGSSLALDLLEDGVADQQPRYARILADQALDILVLPPSDLHIRLAGVCESDVEELFKTAIARAIERPGLASAGAWACLLSLVGRDLIWAWQAADLYWSSATRDRWRILDLALPWRATKWTLKKISEDGYKCSLHELERILLRREAGYKPETIGHPNILPAIIQFLRLPLDKRTPEVLVVNFMTQTVLCRPVSARRSVPHLAVHEGSDCHSDWRVVVEALAFYASPNRESLCRALETAAKYGAPDLLLRSHAIQWPYSACLKSGDIARTAGMCRQGMLGDTVDWREAEKRWRELGITVADLNYMNQSHWPFTRKIGHVGFPFAAAVCLPSMALEGKHNNILRWLTDVPRLRQQISRWTISSLNALDVKADIVSSSQLSSLLEGVADETFDDSLIESVARRALTRDDWAIILDKIGRRSAWRESGSAADDSLLASLGKIYDGHEERVGVLILIAQLFAKASRLPDIKATCASVASDRVEQKASIVIELAQSHQLDAARVEELARMIADIARSDCNFFFSR